MEPSTKSVQTRREDVQVRAESMGINDKYISLLVDTFYDRIRHHSVLGPIFNDAIGDNWNYHLSKMKDFWASVALNAGRYSGQPVPKHKQLSQVQPYHFDVWLNLFQQVLEETAPSPCVVTYFMERAERIAKSLQLAMFGVPGVPLKK